MSQGKSWNRKDLSHTKSQFFLPQNSDLLPLQLGHLLDSGMSVIKDGRSSQSERRDEKSIDFRAGEGCRDGAGGCFWELSLGVTAPLQMDGLSRAGL